MPGFEMPNLATEAPKKKKKGMGKLGKVIAATLLGAGSTFAGQGGLESRAETATPDTGKATETTVTGHENVYKIREASLENPNAPVQKKEMKKGLDMQRKSMSEQQKEDLLASSEDE